jgi:glycosyltransferase involved in cell wall biosynthesis
VTKPNPTPLISVVIPTYNYGHLVAVAIDSALAQTYPNVEVIVVDDGSTDDTIQRLLPYAGRIRVIHQTNQGLSAARNTGIRESRGEYIAFLDSDDAFHPRKLELQCEYLAANRWPVFVATENLTGEQLPVWQPIIQQLQSELIPLESLVLHTCFGSCGVLVHKSCFEKVGYFDESLRSVEDRDMWIRIAAHYPILKLRTALWWYRVTPGSMSRNPERMEQFERIVIEKAFTLPELRGRWLLRRKARGLAAYSSAFMYRIAGRRGESLRLMISSFAWWPWFIRVPDVKMPWGRVRLFVAILQSCLGGRSRTGTEVPS